jgi:radical SAM-linked protein
MNDFRLRIRFAKNGRLAMLAHLELARAMERTVRRSGLPFTLTNGFNAHMKIAFGPALPVGTGSQGEYCDLHMESYIEPDKALAALQTAAPLEMPVLSVGYIDRGAPSLQVSHIYQRYLVKLDPCGQSRESLQDAIDAQVASGELSVKRKKKVKHYTLAERLMAPVTVGPDSCVTVVMKSINGSSVKPEALLEAAFAHLEPEPQIIAITRTALTEEL